MEVTSTNFTTEKKAVKRGRPVGSKTKTVKSPTMKKRSPVKSTAPQFSEAHVKKAQQLITAEATVKELKADKQVLALYNLIK